MRKVILYIAMSLDGYIADPNGGVAWLCGQDQNCENDDSYAAFTKEIDTVLMGRNTYRQIVTELSPTEWIYGDFTTYVFTHQSDTSTPLIQFTNEEPISLIRQFKQQEGKDIWLCGGSDLIHQFMCADLIDRYDISIIPTLLGSGIRLFEAFPKEQKLSLIEMQKNNGIVELIYERRS